MFYTYNKIQKKVTVIKDKEVIGTKKIRPLSDRLGRELNLLG